MLCSNGNTSVRLSVVSSVEETSVGHDQQERMDPVRILVVDDNEINQVVACKFLEKLGCATSTANNGREAIEALRQRDYDAVLMDCEMPDMDGFTATRLIREQEGSQNRHTIIIALSGNVGQEDHERCRAAGMDDCLTKPLRSNALEAILQSFAVL